MKYSIVFSSKTGNTGLLAEKIKDTLPEKECIYSGAPDMKAEEADMIFAGFWTDKGSCGETISEFLRSLRGKQVFLFGTAGFGGSEEYFRQILSRVEEQLDGSNSLIGSYMCQGKMAPAIRKRYESRLSEEPEKMKRLIENFDLALPHPDEADLAHLKEAVLRCLAKG